jgi:hypothetical protein
LGLHRLLPSHGGRVCWVFQQQRPLREGRLEDDAFEVVSVCRDLGVRLILAIALAASAERLRARASGTILVRS